MGTPSRKIIDIPQREKSNEWYTPPRYIEAARAVLGAIDLDPASCALANKTVRAHTYYTVLENGLTQPWYGRIWLNPPYGKPIPYTSRGRYMGGGNTRTKSLQTQFVEKALHEYRAGNAEQILLLVTANTTVRWFQPLWDYPMCTPTSKILFTVAGSAQGQRQVFGNVFVYLGPHLSRFIDVFHRFGRITCAIDTPPSRYRQVSLWKEED